MTSHYFTSVRNWLYQKRILRGKDISENVSSEEILEIMRTPSASKRPSEFARTMGSLLRGEYPSGVDLSSRADSEPKCPDCSY